MFNSLPSPVLFAHRGDSAHAPENTLAAFNLAISQGAPAIEFDVQLTSDEALVVFHDTHLSRTTNGSGKLRDQTLEQLKALNAGVSDKAGFNPASIPTLEEVLTELDPKIFLNIELKSSHSPIDRLTLAVSSTLQAFKAEHRVLISSFNPRALLSFEELIPSIPRGFLIHRPLQVDFYINFPEKIANYQSIHISKACLSARRIKALHKLGKLVFSYTLNSSDLIGKALDLGADGFFTDDPALGLRTITENGYNQIDSIQSQQEYN